MARPTFSSGRTPLLSPHKSSLHPTTPNWYDPRPLILANDDSGLTFIKANATGGWPAGTILHLDDRKDDPKRRLLLRVDWSTPPVQTRC